MKNVDYNKIDQMKKILTKFIDSKDYTLNLFFNPLRFNKILSK